MNKNPLAPNDLFLGDCLQYFYMFTEPLIIAELHPQNRLLDIGCGDGKLVLKLLKVIPLESVVGLDIRHKAIEEARSYSINGAAEFLEIDAQNLESIKQLGSFDAILARTSVHHFVDPISTLGDYITILKPGGKLILIDIDRESACFSLFGFPLTLLITWVMVLKTLGWHKGWRAIIGMKYPSRDWRQHRAVDVAHRIKIGWYYYRDIQSKLISTFPTAKIGRLADCCGYGGVHYMIFQKDSK
jgi:SAM-dependent methyltransferase